MTTSTGRPATPWRAASALVGRRALLKYGFAAAGGALLSACGRGSTPSAPAASASTSVSDGVVSRLLVGTWRVLPWEGPEGPPTEEAAKFGLTSVFDIPRVFPPTPAEGDENARPWPLLVEVTEAGFSVTPQTGGGLPQDDMERASGTWAWEGGALSVALDDATFSAVVGDPAYYNQTVRTRGVPETVPSETSGGFEWNFYEGDPDYISYDVARGMIHLFLPVNDDDGINYLAQRT